MNRPVISALALCCLLACFGATFAAQDAPGTLKELNALLQSSSLPKYVLTLAADGAVVVTDKYERTITFNLRDIGDIAFDPQRSDAEGMIFVRCRGEKACIENQQEPGGAKTARKGTVFGIYPASAAPRVETLLKELQAVTARR